MKYLTFILFFISSIAIYGQEGGIQGKVVDNTNEGIPYISVVIKENNKGVTTANDGTYRLENLQNGLYTLKFSAIGFTTITKKVEVKNNTTTEINVLLEESMEQGAFGFSTGLTLPPSAYADTEEIVQLTSVLNKYENRFYTSHIRAWAGFHKSGVEEAVNIGKKCQ